MAELIQNKAIVDDKRTRDQLIQKGFGERFGKELVLDLKEALYLLEKKKISIKQGSRKINAKALLKHASSKESRFYSKYLVFRDLRDRGYCVKTGFKFGFDFRIYPRGKKPGEAHSERVVKVFTQDDSRSMVEFSRMVRLAGNIKTIFTVAIVDSENDINYYTIERITP